MAIRNDLGIDGQVPMAVDAAYEGILPRTLPTMPGEQVAPRQVAQNTASTPPVVITIELESGNIARLPADTDITNVRANGADLEFVQPDGTVIVVPGGSIANLILFIGDIQIPAEAVTLMFETAGIQPAAGPAGSDGAHGNYDDLGPQNVGDGFRQNSLLDDTTFGGATVDEGDDTATNFAPRLEVLSGTYVIADDGVAGFGGNRPDGSDEFVATGIIVARDVDPLTFSIGAPAGTYSSGGSPVLWDATNPTHLIGYIDSPTGPITVIEFDLSYSKTGAVEWTAQWTVTLSRPLDHFGANDDVLSIPFVVAVSDGSLTSTVTITMAVEDDLPWVFSDDDNGTGVLTGVTLEDDAFDGPDSDAAHKTEGRLFSPGADGLKGLDVVLPVAPDAIRFDSANKPVIEKTKWVQSTDPVTGAGTWSLVLTEDNSVEVARLTIKADGTYEFETFGPLAHHNPANADNSDAALQLTFSYSATDGDNDPFSGSLVINIKDDVPTETDQVVRGTADEDDLASLNLLYPVFFGFWQGSLGTSPYDGSAGDDSITGLFGTVPVWGNLSPLVKSGADGHGGFGLVSEAAAEVWLATANPGQTPDAPGTFLSSKGSVINDARAVTLPILGDAIGFFAADGRLIFGLYVDQDGVYNFRLFDQIDHLQGNGTAAADASQNELFLDISKLITYSDGDGDTIILSADKVVIKIVDDVPVAIGSEHRTVNENDLANFNPLYNIVGPDFWQGSTGTSPYDGFTEGDDSITGLLGTVTVWGTLADNVLGGADGMGKFSIVSETTAETILASLNGGSAFTSRGSAITHAESISILGFGEAMGFFAEDGRLIFGLYVDEIGTYNYRLFDQIDHPTGDGRNELTIDIGKFVNFTDTDGDVIDFSTVFTMTVIDDVPEVRATLVVTLTEADLHNFLPGYDLLKLAGAFIEGSNGTNPANTGPLADILNALGTGQTGLLNTVIPNILLPGQGSNVVAGGADDGGAGFQLISEAAAEALLASNSYKWMSNGARISVVHTLDLSLLGFADATVMGFYAVDSSGHERLVFTLSITDFGGYDIRLFDQIDHVGAGNDTSFTLNLGKFVTYTDFDGDTVDLGPSGNSGDHLVLVVLDDKPVATGAQVFGTVEEEHRNLLTGNDMLHGNEDMDDEEGYDTDTSSNPLEFLNPNQSSSVISNVTSGTLASLVKVGADENGIFTINMAIVGQRVLDANGNQIYSRGQPLYYGFENGKLVGYAESSPEYNGMQSGERRVFSLSLSELAPGLDILSQIGLEDFLNGIIPPGLMDGLVNDTFTFTLLDQIDHPDPNGGATEDTLLIDLSKTVKFTDFDGDTISLADKSFQIRAIDDKPVQIKASITVAAVEEEHNAGPGIPEMNHGNEDWSSTPGGRQPSLDLDDADSTSGRGKTTNAVSGDLRSLVSVGADEVTSAQIFGLGVFNGTFRIGPTAGLPTLTSRGDTVVYDVKTAGGVDTLWAYVDLDGQPGYTAGVDRPVFNLTLVQNGTSLIGPNAGDFKFTLLDQLDHAAPTTPGTAVENILNIDLSSAIRFSDFDGDTITLAPGSFVVPVIDDVPVSKGAVTHAAIIDDDAQTIVAAGNDTPADGVPNIKTVSGVAKALFSIGADDVGSITLTTLPAFSVVVKDSVTGFSAPQAITWSSASVDANGNVTYTAYNAGYPLPAGAATLVINIDGSYSFTMNAPFAHATNSTVEETTGITFSYSVSDYDGDTVTGSLTVRINDDAPTPSAGTAVSGGTTDDEGITIIATGNPGGPAGTDVAGEATFAQGSGFFSSGADGVQSIDVTSAGFNVIGKDANGFATTVAVTWTKLADSGEYGVVKWVAIGGSYTTSNPAASLVIKTNGDYRFDAFAPVSEPGANENDKQLSFSVTVTDGDGDTITRTLNVLINDDTPVGNGTVTASPLDDEAQTLYTPNTDHVPGDVDPNAKSVTGLAGALFSIGADGLKSVALTAAPGAFKVIYDNNGFAAQETATWSTTGTQGANGATTFLATSTHYTAAGTPAASLTIYADGSYTITFNAPVVHDTNSTTEENKSFSFGITVTDGDGDTASVTLNVSVNDDRPVIGTILPGSVDEDGLNGGNPNGVGDIPGEATSASGNLNISFGSDGMAPIAYAPVAGSPTTFNFNTGFAVGTGFSAAGWEFHNWGGNTAIGGTITAGTGPTYQPIVFQSTSGQPFELNSVKLGLAGTAGSSGLKVVITALDALGNEIVGKTVTVTLLGTVIPGTALTSYTYVPTGDALDGFSAFGLKIHPIAGFAGNVYVDDLNVSSVSGSGTDIIDGPITFEDLSSAIANVNITNSNGVSVDPTQLQSNGQAVKYHLIDAVTLVAYTGNTVPTAIDGSNVVFSVVLSSPQTGGKYDFVLRAPLDHPLLNTEDDLNFTFDFKAKDGDGDTVAGSFTVLVDDDTPVIQAPPAASEMLVNGNFASGFDPNGNAWNAGSGVDPDNGSGWNAQATGGGSNVFEVVGPGFHGLTATGGALMADLESSNGNIAISRDVSGLTPGQIYALSFEAGKPNASSGPTEMEVLWNGQVVKAVLSDTNGQMNTYTIYVTAGAGPTNTVGFREISQPEDGHGTYLANVSIKAANVGIVDEDALSGGNEGGPGDVVAGLTATGSLGILWGADNGSARDVTFASSMAGLSTITSDGLAITLAITNNGHTLTATRSDGQPIFTATLDPTAANGSYTFTLQGRVDHGVRGLEDNLGVNMNFVAKDSDGDTVNGSFTVVINDDTPVILTPAAQNLIVNGDFIDGTWSDPQWWGSTANPGQVPGWTIAGDPSDMPSQLYFERQANNFEGLHSSTNGGMIDLGGSPGNYQLSQQVAGVTGGQTYTIAFEAGAPFPGTALMEVWWGNQLLGTIDTNVDEGALAKYSFTVTGYANAAQNVLTFKEIGTGDADLGGQNATERHHGTYIANVRMYSTTATVDEDALSQPNSVLPGAAIATGVLGISWGADSRDAATGAVQDIPSAHDRSVTFTNALVGLMGASAIKSGGEIVHFALTDGNTRLVAYLDSNNTGFSEGQPKVFVVTLSDDQSGAFRFELLRPLDQEAGGGENDLRLEFGFTATDSDGDSVTGSFSVGIDDDVPSILATPSTIQSVVEGENGQAAHVTNGNIDVSIGADKVGAHIQFASTQITDPTGNPLALSSGGTPLFYSVLTDPATGNQTLYAWKTGQDPAPWLTQQPGAQPPVFYVTLQANQPTYGFVIFAPLDHGQSATNAVLPLTFSIRAIDGDGDGVNHTFTVNVTDTTPTAEDVAAGAFDENATIAVDLTSHFSYGNDGGLITLGTPSYSGVPSGVVLGTPTVTLVGNTLTIVPGTAFDAMPAGQSFTLVVPYTVTDGDLDQVTKTVSITINGSNDAAVITGATTGAVTEASGVNNAIPGAPTAMGQLNVTDVDSPATFTVQTNAAATYGTFSITAAGAWSYALNNAHASVQALNVGGTLYDYVTVTSADGTSQQITITINGANDAAVITGATTGAVTEASGVNNAIPGAPTAMGQLNVTDVDSPATFTVQTNAAATYGTFSITAAGAWSYALNNAHASVQALNVGGTLYDYVTVTSADGTSQQITITINGANDAAVITGATTGAVTEATASAPGVPTATGDLNSTDVDNASDAWTVVAAGATSTNGYGTYAVGADGKWTYTLDNTNATVNNLNIGQTLTDTFKAKTVDGTEQVVTITIHGVTDAPAIPAPKADTIQTNLGDGQIAIPVYALLANDGVPLHSNLTITGLTGGASLSADGKFVNISFNGAGPVSFNYQLFDGTSASAATTVSITRTSDKLDAANGDNFYIARDWGENIGGGQGNDIIVKMGGGADGGQGNDTIIGLGGNNVLTGGQGEDVLYANWNGGHTSILNGEQGNDILHGGHVNGTTTMTGGQGQDTFVLHNYSVAGNIGSATNTITDYVIGDDVIDLSELLVGLGGDLASHVRIVYGGNVGNTHLLSDSSPPPAINGDVTIQVDQGGWKDVVRITDTGSNLTTGSDTFKFILDGHTIITHDI